MPQRTFGDGYLASRMALGKGRRSGPDRAGLLRIRRRSAISGRRDGRPSGRLRLIPEAGRDEL